MANTKIIIATHKAYHFPNLDYYQPILVGKSLQHQSISLLGDNTGDHISNKNKYFCELTALYWSWRNHYFKDADYIGLVHYRRYFKGTSPFMTKKILSNNEISQHLKTYDCILPKKRNYYIESVYSHYKNAHFIRDLDLTREIILEKYPNYLPNFDQLMRSRKLHLYNMFIMKQQYVAPYCQWLFSILFELEKRLDISAYDYYQQRVFGFIAERLFNVWILHHQLLVKEIPVVSLEKENWLKKIINFLKRKFVK